MTAFQSRLDGAALQATCQLLSTAGESLFGYGMVSLAASGTGLVPLTVGAAAILASNTACPWDPNQSTGISGPTTGNCVAVTGGGGTPESSERGSGVWSAFGTPCQTVNISVVEVQGPGNFTYEFSATLLDGTSQVQLINSDTEQEFRLAPCDGATCGQTGSSGFPTIPDTQYTDPDTGCELNVEFLGIAADQSGLPAPVYQISPILPPATTRTSGGIISGCNFEPVIYMSPPGGGGGDDGPIVVPVPPEGPGPDPDWWADLIAGAVGGLSAIAIDRALDELFATTYPGGSRTITAACDYQQDGTPEEFTVTFPDESYQDRVLTSLDAIVSFQEQILKWKTPVCFGNHPSGTPYMLTWVSDEQTPSGRTLVKELKYWDQSGKTFEEHFLHWKDFSWQAGPVVVGLNGSKLGQMRVWAESEAEGKRVVEHAAAISDVTLSESDYFINTSSSSRFGQPGTMRLKRDGERWWIGNRSTSSGPPTYPAS